MLAALEVGGVHFYAVNDCFCIATMNFSFPISCSMGLHISLWVVFERGFENLLV